MEDPLDEKKNGGIDENSEGEETIFGEFANLSDENQLAEIDFNGVDTGRWLLKVISGPNNGAEFAMHAGANYIVGIDPSHCDIVFHDNSVSRQHARISIDDSNNITIEDLNSRNGLIVDGDVVKGSHTLEPNGVVTLGTTSFVVYDREGEMQTIISPFLPDIVNALKKSKEEEAKKNEEIPESEVAEQPPPQPPVVEVTPPKPNHTSAYILIGALVALLGIVGFGVISLFQSTPVVVEQKADPAIALKEALAPFPSVSYYFTPKTGQLTLVGHLLTLTDRNRLIYNLQGLNFINNIDDVGVVIDQLVYSEMNQVLERKKWLGISMIAPSPGKFVLTGYLKTREQSEALADYITANFPYLDRLENRVVVEENVISTIQQDLLNKGIRGISVAMVNGDVTLTGTLPRDKAEAFQTLLAQFKQIPGVRAVKDFVAQLAEEEAVVNISDRYQVTGVSRIGANLNVVVNGRILFKGDSLDGMTITEIKPNAVFLEKDNVKYRIDF